MYNPEDIKINHYLISARKDSFGKQYIWKITCIVNKPAGAVIESIYSELPKGYVKFMRFQELTFKEGEFVVQEFISLPPETPLISRLSLIHKEII